MVIFALGEFDEVFVFEDLMTVLSAFDFQRIVEWRQFRIRL